MCRTCPLLYFVFGDLTWPWPLHDIVCNASCLGSLRTRFGLSVSVHSSATTMQGRYCRNLHYVPLPDLDLTSDLLKQKNRPLRSAFLRAFDNRFPRPSTTIGSEVRQGAESAPPPPQQGAYGWIAQRGAGQWRGRKIDLTLRNTSRSPISKFRDIHYTLCTYCYSYHRWKFQGIHSDANGVHEWP